MDTSFTLVARDHLQSTVLEQRIDESSWAEDKSVAWLTTSPDTMSALTGVELTFHGPSGDRTLAAAELGTPTEVSPNGEHCEPHVLQSAFTVEREALVRSGT